MSTPIQSPTNTQSKTTNNQIECIKLKVYHYPLNKYAIVYDVEDDELVRVPRNAFYFTPRVLRPGTFSCKGVTEQGLAVTVRFIEQILEKVIENDDVIAEINFVYYLFDDIEQEKAKLKSVIEKTFNKKVYETKETLRFTTTVKNFEELKKLYETLDSIVKNNVKHPEDIKTLIHFPAPLVIYIPKDEIKRLYDELLKTDSLLNSETAEMLFGREFAEIVRNHNRAVRAKRCKKHNT